ncbi:glycosyltransferase family protein [Lactococcus petauri]|uniref:hypothetical protein n=1 Tax=Lactococcus petauri TaxID=1940789 RepID=UPI0022E56366|nr:hypothetical protein [Lactococcus petauri]
MNLKLSGHIEKWWVRNLIFLALSCLLILIFFNGRWAGDTDAAFHLNRIYELSQNIRSGHLFPDVSYFSFNHSGYGVNFFYPWLINYPVAFIWALSNSPIFSLIIGNVVYHMVGFNIAYDTYYQWRRDYKFSFLFSILYILGSTTVNIRMMSLGTYNNQIAFMFLPWAVMGIWQIIARNYKDWWIKLVISVSLISFSHILSLYLLILLAFFIFLAQLVLNRKVFSIERSFYWIKSSICILLLSAIFILPLLEQRLSNDWLSVPAMNLGKNGVITNYISNADLVSKIHTGFSLEQPLNLLFILTLLLLVVYKIKDRTILYLLFAIVGIIVIQSTVFPWWFLETYSFFDMIQFTNRFDIFWYLFVSLFSVEVLRVIPSSNILFNNYFYKIVLFLSLFLVLNIISQQPKNANNTTSWLMSDKNIKKALSNPNFLYFSKDSGGLYYTNGFMDYRTSEQIPRTEINNKNVPETAIGQDKKYQINLERLKVENQNAFSPILNFKPTHINDSNIFVENAVKFDNNISLHHFSQEGLEFIIDNIPVGVKTIRTPITYLKGFVANDSLGNTLKTYKDDKGFLAIDDNNSQKVTITYQKTILHKASIIISIIAWLLFIFGIVSKKITKGGRRAKALNNRSRVQRRRSTRTVRR